MIDKEDIKDILIHFEEGGYSIRISDPFIWGLNTMADILSPVGISVTVSIRRNNPKLVLSFKEWDWINTTLKTALSRINQESIEKEVALDCNKIIIVLKEQLILLKNINSLVRTIKKFNAMNLGGVIRIKYDEVNNKIGINFYKESNKNLNSIFDELSKDFYIKTLNQNDDKKFGLIANLEPKNFEIYE